MWLCIPTLHAHIHLLLNFYYVFLCIRASDLKANGQSICARDFLKTTYHRCKFTYTHVESHQSYEQKLACLLLSWPLPHTPFILDYNSLYFCVKASLSNFEKVLNKFRQQKCTIKTYAMKNSMKQTCCWRFLVIFLGNMSKLGKITLEKS